jgi:hypothetical protein
LNVPKTTFAAGNNSLIAFCERKRQEMSIIIRMLVIVACAYAGSALAAMQFPEVPDPSQIAVDQ